MPRHHHPSTTSLASVLVALLASSVLVTAADAAKFADCTNVTFYSTLSGNSTTWTREELQSLLKSRHETVPFTNAANEGTDDAWAAIRALDPELEFNVVKKVHLLYKNVEVNAVPFGGVNWQRGHVWDVRRGISADGADYSDVHNLRPVMKAGEDERKLTQGYFGECGALEAPNSCTEPAAGGASDTCKCSKLYEPADDRKGEIARTLLYMDLRYDGSETNTQDLTLTDCPFDLQTDMGYLSQVLQWNTMYPPDARELNRNDVACGDWQNNRNPFVDFPELAERLYPAPQALPAQGELSYASCADVPTQTPASPPNECEKIKPGDIYVYLMNSQDPDEVGLFPFVDLPEGLVLYMTDNAWDGLKYKTNEGILKLTVPAGGIKFGTQFGFGPQFSDLPGNDWKKEEGVFSLTGQGDQIFLYCFSGDNMVQTKLGFSYSGEWAASGLPDYGLNESALPPELKTKGSIVLPHFDNYQYDGPSAANKRGCDSACVIAGLEDTKNYDGRDDVRFQAGRQSGANAVIGLSFVTLSTLVVAFFGAAAL